MQHPFTHLGKIKMTIHPIDLSEAIEDYLLWMPLAGYHQTTVYHYQRILRYFLEFISSQKITQEMVFTSDTLYAFEEMYDLVYTSQAVKGLSRYLYRQERLSSPIRKHLQKNNIELLNLSIEQVDNFLKIFNDGYAHATKRHHRTVIRGFLRYLYRERKVLRKDLASLLAAAPMFAYANPPKFLRQHEIKQLFASLNYVTSKDLRANAMLYLSYTLGLRPKEISLIRLDDIFFKESEIALTYRKNNTPIRLPIPEDTLKTICAYIIGARPQTTERALFLTLHPPYKPVSSYSVCSEITACLRKANIFKTAYSLRHTYAQNLLEAGCSIFEVKEMLGHDKIETTKRYLFIHTQLMRKVLFDETI